ncbi:PAB-dependent poly(A)-specific ribonuclease subunit 3 [Puccinia graminis f. sp. tritici]|uniref:PAN2-PAN3 deadenylation complex subunit PAN3 n=2 Tax=Puccinia graminis f. sp. tritici TaxID=56615 RepID=E3K3D8_PUCGT|nr:uncharacterized protein PGTG_04951 [Puccinia graminis f. sp. tritici CRL 75-36-700-3]EFP78995.2 hypothetical protein PGTG_04951 [Puccinia graminis f. sp. tritici CRL 75-36-700-3]KAA1069548.1 PAB-dependent poly(A)-specific ribonuclease subunit 3 [Puccinia graminis f. sp. tritici]
MGTRSAAVQIRPPSSTTSATSSPRPVLASISHSAVPASNLQQKVSDADNQSHNESNGSSQFNHQTSPTISTGRKSSPSSPRKFSLPHPARPATATPIASSGASLTTNAPVFVPSGTLNPYHPPSGRTGQQVKLNKSAAEFAPSGLVPTSDSSTLYNHSNTSESAPSYSSSSSTSYPGEPTFHPHNPYAYDAERLLHSQATHHPITEAYMPHDGFMPHNRVSAPSLSNFQRPLNYHLYAPPLPHSSNQHPQQLALNKFFMPASIRETLQKKSAATLQGPTHEVARTPEDLGVYHSLVVLDSPHVTNSSTSSLHPTITGGATNGSSTMNPAANAHRSPYSSRVLKNPCWIYKAFCSLDGKAYCLYRVEGVRLKQGQGEAAIGQVERWRKIRHPAIVNVREAFTTRAFGDHSILFAYDYHPLSQTLYDEHISAKKSSTRTFATDEVEHPSNLSNPTQSGSRYNRHRSANGHPSRIGLSEERIIWSYVIQIANAIKTVHSANLSVRTIDPTKIILTGTNRVRINACGILDVTEYSPNQSPEDLQVEDLRDLGCLICSLASSSICIKTDNNSLTKGVEYVKQFYSAELSEVVAYLLAPALDGHTISIEGLLRMLWSRSLDEMTKVFNHNDLLEESLSRELENGRLVRLMVKLGFINERPEFDHDPNWSETSERYLLKLFRDYVFHQVDSQAKPVTDLSHVLMCLNKLDTSSDEKLTLISRDDQTCAIVTYAEIRRIMDSAFRDLSR